MSIFPDSSTTIWFNMPLLPDAGSFSLLHVAVVEYFGDFLMVAQVKQFEDSYSGSV